MLGYDKDRLGVLYAEFYLAALLSTSIVLVLPIIILVVLSAPQVRQRAHIASTRRSSAPWSSGPGRRGCLGSWWSAGLRLPCGEPCTCSSLPSALAQAAIDEMPA